MLIFYDVNVSSLCFVQALTEEVIDVVMVPDFRISDLIEACLNIFFCDGKLGAFGKD